MIDPTQILKDNDLRIISSQAASIYSRQDYQQAKSGMAWFFWIHLNDFRFCDWDKLSHDLREHGFLIDDDFDGEVNQIRIFRK